MKTFVAFVLILFTSNKMMAQTPSQAEMEKMMKEAKKMMDSLGIKTPTIKDAPKVGDKALAEAYEEQTRLVPKKDAARIASIPKAITDGAMPAFISKTHSNVTDLLPAQIKQEAEQIYQYVKTKENSNDAISNAASGLWLSGNYKHAVYLMGKATLENFSNADNLNNYAAFLTMSGAEQAAIPILMNLNIKFPKNSTILNNLGQAWFGLGETGKAEKYLDSAIMFFGTHSQANYTKCLLEQNKGDKKKATDAMKRSLKNSYSKEKDSKLRDLGYELNDKDLTWNFPIPVDALGLEKFHLPKYPTTVEQCDKLKPEWDAFRKACKEQMQILKEKNKKLLDEAAQQAIQVQKDLLSAVANKQRVTSVALIPFYHSKAVKKLIYLIDDKDGSINYNRIRISREGEDVQKKAAQLRTQRTAELNKLSKDYHIETIRGDGGISEQEYCQMQTAIYNKYLSIINKLFEGIQTQSLEFGRKQLNNTAYFNLFATDPITFEIYKNEAKAGWLNTLASCYVEFSFCSVEKEVTPEVYGNKLPDFDDLHCNYHSWLNFGVGRFDMTCSRMRTQLDAGPLKLDIKEDLNTGEVIRGTVEIHESKKIGSIGGGPVKAEAKVGAGVQVEFDKGGITDVIVKAEAEVKAGSNVIDKGPKGNETILPPGVGDKSATIAGAEVRYGWNSGGAVEGKGILKGLKL